MSLADYESKTLFISSRDRKFSDYINPMEFTVIPPAGTHHHSDQKSEECYIRCLRATLPSAYVDGTARATADSVVEVSVANATDVASDIVTDLVAVTGSITDGTIAATTAHVSLRNTLKGKVARISGNTFVSAAGGSIWTARDSTDETSQISVILAVAGSAYTSSGTADYFRIFTPSVNYYVWFNRTDGSTTEPTGVPGTGVQVDVTNATTAANVAAAVVSAFSSIGAVSASASNMVTITNDNVGVVAAPIGGSFASHNNNALFVSRQGTASVSQQLILVTGDANVYDSSGLGDYFIFSTDSTVHTVWFDIASGNQVVDTIRLAATSSSTNGFYNGNVITLISGTGSGQTRSIVQYYGGASQIAVLNTAWATAPNNTSVYRIQTIMSMPYVLLDVTFGVKAVRGIISATDKAHFRSSFVLYLDHYREMSSDTPFVHCETTPYMKAVIDYNKPVSIIVRAPDETVISYVNDTSDKVTSMQTSFLFEVVPVRAVNDALYETPYGAPRILKGGQVSNRLGF